MGCHGLASPEVIATRAQQARTHILPCKIQVLKAGEGATDKHKDPLALQLCPAWMSELPVHMMKPNLWGRKAAVQTQASSIKK